MRIEDVREANRKAGVELVTDLGYDPNDVAEHLDIVGRSVEITVVERDADGNVKVDGNEFVTHVDRKRITADQLARYRATQSAVVA